MRDFAIAAASFLAFGLISVAVGVIFDSQRWFIVHGISLLAGTMLIGIEGMHFATLARFRKEKFDRSYLGAMFSLYVVGASALTLGLTLQPSGIFSAVALVGWAALIAGSVLSTITHIRSLPKRGESVVDIAADPLTKGDDASWKHVKLAHMFLPLGLLLLAIASVMSLFNDVGHALNVAGIHVVGLGFGLLSMYGIGHLWVPRFSGIPAIAAGAIKGELHSTMPAMILLPLGFALQMRGFIIAGGAFAFLGFFTYMGVLGANIMKNKSKTHRVTPEFVYVPWTFTGIFWLVNGVLMGLFLTVVPELLADYDGALTAIHVHIILFGGIIQLILGWLTRIIPVDAKPPRFAGAMRGAFFAFNASVALALWYTVSATPWAALSAIGLLAIAGLAFFKAMQGYLKRPSS
jgi:hypothetical protein